MVTVDLHRVVLGFGLSLILRLRKSRGSHQQVTLVTQSQSDRSLDDWTHWTFGFGLWIRRSFGQEYRVSGPGVFWAIFWINYWDSLLKVEETKLYKQLCHTFCLQFMIPVIPVK